MSPPTGDDSILTVSIKDIKRIDHHGVCIACLIGVLSSISLFSSTRQQSQTAPGGKVKRAGGETVIDNARMSSGHALLGRTTKKNPR